MCVCILPPVVPTITSVTDESRPVCEGEQVVLTCKAEGNPKPYLAWKRKGIVLQNSTNTNYTISNLKREDEGNYTCVATNIVDSKSEVANIADVQCECRTNEGLQLKVVKVVFHTYICFGSLLHNFHIMCINIYHMLYIK